MNFARNVFEIDICQYCSDNMLGVKIGPALAVLDVKKRIFENLFGNYTLQPLENYLDCSIV